MILKFDLKEEYIKLSKLAPGEDIAYCVPYDIGDDGKYIKEYCGTPLLEFDGRYLKRYCGMPLYEVEGNKIKEYCGNYLYEIDGFLSGKELLGLLAILFA